MTTEKLAHQKTARVPLQAWIAIALFVHVLLIHPTLQLLLYVLLIHPALQQVLS